MTGILWVVATPIGNLDDLSLRAVKVLSEVDLIAAEDTRQSRVLLERYGIKKPLASCHKFNEAEKLAYFIGELRNGKHMALISDAGTPCVSDPGHRLIEHAAREGVDIVPVPGASAVIAALSVSGFDASAFTFWGFLPRSGADLRKTLNELTQRRPVVFYESPKRILRTLTVLAEAFPYARVCLCNDLTKKFERIYRGTPEQVVAALSENPHAEKGEYVCVVEDGMPLDSMPMNGMSLDGMPLDSMSLEAQLTEIMVSAGVSLKTAVQILHESHQKRYAKKEIYAASLRLKAILDKSGDAT